MSEYVVGQRIVQDKFVDRIADLSRDARAEVFQCRGRFSRLIAARFVHGLLWSVHIVGC
jgi:hypothetical protein